jgi:site-specific recombinase XerD
MPFRHHYRVSLALRGVPQAVISQLMGRADPRATAIYTTVASSVLIAALVGGRPARLNRGWASARPW